MAELRERRARENAPRPSPPRRQEQEGITEENPGYADHVYGIGEIGASPEMRTAKSRLNPERFPGLPVNPDEEQSSVKTSVGRLLLAPRKDKDKVESSLADSYGG